MDHLTKEKRSAAMAKVKSKNTSAENIVRKILDGLKISYKIYEDELPGKPDFVFPRKKKVIFVNGCFWHLHRCKRIPKTNRKFWKNKFENNMQRDRRVKRKLNRMGWSVYTVWECWKKNPETLKYRIRKYIFS